MQKFYRVISKTELAEASDEEVTIGGITYKKPSIDLLHKVGYWPKDPECPPEPKPEEGYKIFDDGWAYIDDGQGGKLVTHKYRKLKIVDPGYPVLKPDQEILEDYWKETETEYIHVIVVYDVIDPKPEIDEKTHHLKEKHWDIDREAHTKTAVYVIVRRVDNPPELKKGEEIVENHWAYSMEGDEEVYEHFYRVMTVIRDLPVLKPGEEIVDEWYTDDLETNTRTYHYKVMLIIDNPPVLEPGQQIVERWYEDDEEAHTRTWHYEVRYIVDNPPDLKHNIEADWWEDDGKTRTHVYEVHEYIDEPPVLQPGQDIISDRWEIDDKDPLHIVHTHIYEVRHIVDTPQPDLDETHFIYQDYWEDDGVNYTHIWDVWEYYDEPKPEVDPYLVRVVDLGIVDDFERKTRGHKWFCKKIVRNKPEDDPDGNFKWVEDGEIDHGDWIEITYRQVWKIWRKISKLKLEAALFKMGILARLDKFLISTTVKNELGHEEAIKRFYDQANELDEKHPLFKPYYQAAIEALGIKPEEADALIDACAWDPLEAFGGLTNDQKELLKQALEQEPSAPKPANSAE